MALRFLRNAGFLLLTSALAVSCLEELERLDKISDSGIEPIVEFPLINSDFTMREFLTEGESQARITEGPDGTMVLVYDDTLRGPTAGLFFSVPDQQSPTIRIEAPEVNFPSPGSTITITKSISFDFATLGQALDSIELADGTISLEAASTMPYPVALTIEIPSIKSANGAPYVQLIDLNGSGEQSLSESLANATLDLTENGTTTNSVAVTLTAEISDNGSGINSGDEIAFSFQMLDLEFQGLFGNMGTFGLPIKDDSIKVDVFNNVVEGDFELLSPTMRLDFLNSFGIPMSVDIQDITTVKDGNVLATLSGPAVEAPLNPYVVAAPSYQQIGQSVLTPLELNPDNSNLAAMVSSLPEYLSYHFDLEVNPANTAPKNYVVNTSTLEVGVHLELPFHGQLRDLQFRKRFDFNGLGIDDVGSSKIKLKTSNEIPVEIAVQILFLDGNGQVLESLFADPRIVAGAPVGGDGFSTGAAEVEMEVALDQDKVSRMNNAVALEMVAIVFTSNAGTVPVKFSANDQFQVSLGLSTKLKYNLN